MRGSCLGLRVLALQEYTTTSSTQYSMFYTVKGVFVGTFVELHRLLPRPKLMSPTLKQNGSFFTRPATQSCLYSCHSVLSIAVIGAMTKSYSRRKGFVYLTLPHPSPLLREFWAGTVWSVFRNCRDHGGMLLTDLLFLYNPGTPAQRWHYLL